MDNTLKGKLERYLRNDNGFLWGLVHGTQKEVYSELRAFGEKKWGAQFDFRNGTYDQVTGQLLVNPGIERLLEDLIIPKVKERFSEQALSALKKFWCEGERPQAPLISHFNIMNPSPFLVVTSSNFRGKTETFVNGWTTFAGIWFEEIEPLSDSTPKK
jgi:hypothetical protein